MTTGEKIMDTIQVLIVAVAVVAVIGGITYAIVYNAENSEKQKAQRYERCLNQGGVMLDGYKVCVWGGGPVR